MRVTVTGDWILILANKWQQMAEISAIPMMQFNSLLDYRLFTLCRSPGFSIGSVGHMAAVMVLYLLLSATPTGSIKTYKY